MQSFFFKWSRKLHKWLGVYAAILALVWIGELLLLPALHPVTPVDVAQSQAIVEQPRQAGALSFEELSRRVQSGLYGQFGADIEISYFPLKKRYVVLDRESFAISEIDSLTGELFSRYLDGSSLFARKSGLGWANETLGAILKAPFELSFIILSVTGLYLVLYPYLRRKDASGQGILGLSPGDSFRFEASNHPRDMARIAALGLLPGVNATVMSIPCRGPVVLSARNTRIAVARNVAASFLFEKAEA